MTTKEVMFDSVEDVKRFVQQSEKQPEDIDVCCGSCMVDGKSILGIIEPIPEADVHMPSGSGPRYGEFSRDGKHFYLINELSSQVTHFFYHNGKMIEKDSVCTLPDDFTGYNICSDQDL